MSGEKILISSDSIVGPTGFATNARTIAWALAKDYEVHVLGLQSIDTQRVKIGIHGDQREVIQHANYPRGPGRWDFGARSLPPLLDQLKPDVLLTVNDIQMISHIPGILYPNTINLKAMDLPSRKLVSEDALRLDMEAQVQKFKERYPLDMKWILLGPQDGEPPMPQWNNIYGVADQVVAMAKYGQQIFKQFYGIDCPYIYHAIDTELFDNREKPLFQDKFVIGNFNRNQPRKQPVRCIKAFAKFAHDKNDVLLHMQQDWNDQFGWPLDYFGRLYGCLNKMLQPKQVGMPREEVANTYNCWDINVTPTGGEGFGLCEIEGMSCGLPNVVTDYTTSRELTIEGKPSPRGYLVPYKELYWEKMDVAAVQRSAIDVDELAKAFQFYYDNRELCIKHGENAREWTAKHCSINTIQKRWQKLVKDTLNK